MMYLLHSKVLFSLRCSAMTTCYFILTQLITYINFITCEDNINITIKNSESTNNLFNLTQNSTNKNDTTDYINDSDYIDTELSILHPNMIEDLYKKAQKKNKIAEIEFEKTVGRRQRNRKEAFYQNPFFVNKTLELMMQSIYATRYRLRDTMPIRKKFEKDIAYNGAIHYGSLMQMRMKMDNIYTTMVKFNLKHMKFLWYIVLYERCLSISVDVNYMVQKLFAMQTQAKELFGDLDSLGNLGDLANFNAMGNGSIKP